MNEAIERRTEKALDRRPEARPVERPSSALTSYADQARAAVESRYKIALLRPRDLMEVRSRLLAECQRPRFAESARFALPWAKGRDGRPVTGWSIRFAEAASRCLGNILTEVTVVYDDDERQKVRIDVSDLEANSTFSEEREFYKTIERRDARDRSVVSSRQNSAGGVVYICVATDEEVANKRAAIVSKAVRNGILRHIPGDITDECLDRITETQEKSDVADPNSAIKRMCDGFGELRVSPSALAAYLGHPADTCSPSELAELRAVYASIRDGELSWSDVMKSRDVIEKVDSDGVVTHEAPPAAAKVRAALGAKKAAPAPAPPAIVPVKPEPAQTAPSAPTAPQAPPGSVVGDDVDYNGRAYRVVASRSGLVLEPVALLYQQQELGKHEREPGEDE